VSNPPDLVPHGRRSLAVKSDAVSTAVLSPRRRRAGAICGCHCPSTVDRLSRVTTASRMRRRCRSSCRRRSAGCVVARPDERARELEEFGGGLSASSTLAWATNLRPEDASLRRSREASRRSRSSSVSASSSWSAVSRRKIWGRSPEVTRSPTAWRMVSHAARRLCYLAQVNWCDDEERRLGGPDGHQARRRAAGRPVFLACVAHEDGSLSGITCLHPTVTG
jgi:hypothetical protein